jgi:hypothetical protein
MQSGGTQPVFQRNIPTPPLQLKSMPSSASRTQLVSHLVYTLTLKMEAIYSSKTSLYYHQPTLRKISKHKSFHSHSCENLKAAIKINHQKFSKKCYTFNTLIILIIIIIIIIDTYNDACGSNYLLHYRYVPFYTWLQSHLFQYGKKVHESKFSS